VKFKKHIEDEALKEATTTRSFRDKNGDSYELSLRDDQVKLDCYLMGSILGGTGTECIHTINGPKLGDFLAELGAKDSKNLYERVAGYAAKDWQELHQVISKHQTDVSVWEDTDWSDSIELTVAITGEAKVGSVLTAIAIATSTEGTFPITYQWYSSHEPDGEGEPIESATEPTYTLAAADHGKFIWVNTSSRDEIEFNSSYKSSEHIGPVA